MIRVLLFAISLLSCGANAGAAIEQLAIDAKSIQGINGKFTQSRHIAILSTPLRSAGEFRYQREIGLVWHVSRPVESTLEISYDKGLRLVNDDGEAKSVTGAELLTQLFLGLFSGNLDALLDIFNIDEHKDEATWRLHLTPKSDALRQHISHINIVGNNGVNAITVVETSGDRNEIHLLEQHIERSIE